MSQAFQHVTSVSGHAGYYVRGRSVPLPHAHGVPPHGQEGSHGQGRQARVLTWIEQAWARIWRKPPAPVYHISGRFPFVLPPAMKRELEASFTKRTEWADLFDEAQRAERERGC